MPTKEMTCDCIESGKPLEGTTGHTASCNYARRRAEKQALKPVKAPKPIAKVSDKMAQALRQYAELRRWFLTTNPICEVFRDRPSTDVHHMKGRATIELLLDTNYWLAVSREAHQKIELNPDWAKEMGYSLSRLADEPHKI
jgi:hypothetical protein